MLLVNMNRDQLQRVLLELDQALYNHQQWHYDLLRTLACRMPGDKHDVTPKAHKECRFGQWYYNQASLAIKDHPGFHAIGEAHRAMHQFATKLLIDVNDNTPIKPLDYDNFANSLMRLRLEISSLKNELEILLYSRDPLTMAINRINMLPLLREQHEMVKRDLQTCCIAMFDLDLFKKVNDKYGHTVGDKVLVIVAHYLMNNIRVYDKLFRYGGEEFLLCAPQSDLSQTFEIVERLRMDIEKMSLNVGLEKPLHITISCGITMLDPDVTIEEAIERSDKALYFAKFSGRNQTQIWKPGMNANNKA